MGGRAPECSEYWGYPGKQIYYPGVKTVQCKMKSLWEWGVGVGRKLCTVGLSDQPCGPLGLSKEVHP